MNSNLAEILTKLRGDPIDSTTKPDVVQPVNKVNQDNLDSCNCRKSQCLKLYCQCFASKKVCSSSCRCLSCSNIPSMEAIRQSTIHSIEQRNPYAFNPKFLKDPSSENQVVNHPIGCKCRKSMCLKKYCECFQASVPCTSSCVCVGCYNTSEKSSTQSRSGDLKVFPTSHLYESDMILYDTDVTQEDSNPGHAIPLPVMKKSSEYIDHLRRHMKQPSYDHTSLEQGNTREDDDTRRISLLKGHIPSILSRKIFSTTSSSSTTKPNSPKGLSFMQIMSQPVDSRSSSQVTVTSSTNPSYTAFSHATSTPAVDNLSYQTTQHIVIKSSESSTAKQSSAITAMVNDKIVSDITTTTTTTTNSSLPHQKKEISRYSSSSSTSSTALSMISPISMGIVGALMDLSHHVDYPHRRSTCSTKPKRVLKERKTINDEDDSSSSSNNNIGHQDILYNDSQGKSQDSIDVNRHLFDEKENVLNFNPSGSIMPLSSSSSSSTQYFESSVSKPEKLKLHTKPSSNIVSEKVSNDDMSEHHHMKRMKP